MSSVKMTDTIFTTYEPTPYLILPSNPDDILEPVPTTNEADSVSSPNEPKSDCDNDKPDQDHPGPDADNAPALPILTNLLTAEMDNPLDLSVNKTDKQSVKPNETFVLPSRPATPVPITPRNYSMKYTINDINGILSTITACQEELNKQYRMLHQSADVLHSTALKLLQSRRLPLKKRKLQIDSEPKDEPPAKKQISSQHMVDIIDSNTSKIIGTAVIEHDNE